jgi:preprotein translocase SecE subunit
VAKTIGKDKGSATRARAAMTRSRAASAAETEPVGDPSNDEPRDEDIVVADESDDTADDLEATPESDGDDVEATGRELAVPDDGALARRTGTTSVARGTSVPAPLMANPVTRFMAESYLELRKVTWPTMNEAWNMTLIVIAMSAIVAVILGVADAGLVKALGWFLTTTHSGAPTPTPTPTP